MLWTALFIFTSVCLMAAPLLLASALRTAYLNGRHGNAYVPVLPFGVGVPTMASLSFSLLTSLSHITVPWWTVAIGWLGLTVACVHAIIWTERFGARRRGRSA
jgi:hypothetical protein